MNLSNGNLVVEAGDMMVPNKGIALSFARTYNSLSQHDYNGTDGSTPSNYGNGWTNLFDAHLANLAGGGLTIYDGSGTRFDYASNGQGGYTPPAGVYAQLTWDGGSGYFWTGKNGVQLYFYSPNMPTSCNCPALAGRLNAIYGRNSLNNLKFAYFFDSGNATSSANLNKVIVTAEDGRTATLLFANFGNHRLMSSLAWPDGTIVSYGYDGAGRLTQVAEPGNGSTGTTPRFQQYNYTAAGLLQSVSTPVWVYTNGNSGAYVYYAYSPNNKVANIYYTGTVNFAPSDNTNSPLQPGAPTGLQTYRSITLAYSSGTTTVSDTDGHQVTYSLDAFGRVTQRQVWTGQRNLTTSQGWYSPPDLRAHHVAFTKDTRGNETDYAYDNTGNLIATGAPQTTLSTGTFRPTAWQTYDTHNNLTGQCDSVAVHAHGGDWTATPAPTANLCPPGTSGSTQMVWTAPGSGNEPFGELTSITKPSGYQSTIAYSASAQGGSDYGLPTSTTGAQFTQKDGSTVIPMTSSIYDSHGNMICRSNGASKWTVNQFNILSQLTATGDPDDTSLSGSACGKTNGTYKSARYNVYFPSGQLECTITSAEAGSQTPSCSSGGQNIFSQGPQACVPDTFSPVSVCYGYDANGNTIGLGGDTTQARTFIYDGDDRLIEVALPYDSTHDYFTASWLTRYLYDLTQDGSVSIGDSTYGMATFQAHGALYKSQRYLTAPIKSGTSGATFSWIDASGTSFDASGRPVNKYAYSPGGMLQVTATTYDATAATLGLVSSSANPIGDVIAMTYDSNDRIVGVTSTTKIGGGSGDTPNRTLTYDADGRVASVATSAFGTQSYGYDVDGNLVSSTEPAGGSGTAQYATSGQLSSPATLAFGHYPNGWKSSTSVTSSALTQTNLKTFVYRDDGKLAQATLAYNGSSYPFTYAYSPAGRLVTKTDPYYTTTWNPAVANTFDQYGRMASYKIPAGTYSSISVATSGLLTGYIVATKQVALTYSARGELLGKQLGTTQTAKLQSADGFLYPPDTQKCHMDKFQTGTVCLDTSTNFDERVAAPLGTSTVTDPSSTTTLPTPAPTSSPIAYDAAGRMTKSGVAWQYDTVHHPIASGTSKYAWGPNGHPIMANSGSGDVTMHWEGRTLLFTSNASGQLTDLKFGVDADITPQDSAYKGLTVWDRDLSGVIVSQHNSSTNGQGMIANGPWFDTAPNLNGPTTQLAVAGSGFVSAASFSSIPAGGAPANGLFAEPRPDGISDGTTVIQGVRAYDTADGVWTTPDPSGGSAEDPMSQLPYIYNNSNPASYLDPTGQTPHGGPIEVGFFNSADAFFAIDWAANQQALAQGAAQQAMINAIQEIVDTLDGTIATFADLGLIDIGAALAAMDVVAAFQSVAVQAVSNCAILAIMVAALATAFASIDYLVAEGTLGAFLAVAAQPEIAIAIPIVIFIDVMLLSVEFGVGYLLVNQMLIECTGHGLPPIQNPFQGQGFPGGSNTAPGVYEPPIET